MGSKAKSYDMKVHNTNSGPKHQIGTAGNEKAASEKLSEALDKAIDAAKLVVINTETPKVKKKAGKSDGPTGAGGVMSDLDLKTVADTVKLLLAEAQKQMAEKQEEEKQKLFADMTPKTLKFVFREADSKLNIYYVYPIEDGKYDFTRMIFDTTVEGLKSAMKQVLKIFKNVRNSGYEIRVVDDESLSDLARQALKDVGVSPGSKLVLKINPETKQAEIDFLGSRIPAQEILPL